MVDIDSIKHGDIVKIVDNWGDWCFQNPDGLMDRWLGKIMTVRRHSRSSESLRMYEDAERWRWYPQAIDYVVSNEPPNDDIKLVEPTRKQLDNLLFGQK